MDSRISKFLFLIFFLKTNFNFSQSNEINFCDRELCPYQGQHVACGKNRTFSKDCKGEVKLEDMKDYISLILKEHNHYRNQLAGGNITGKDPAVRMPIVHWDWDLALTAEYNVRTCVFAHDECRNTKRFRNAGQNIYWLKTTQLDLNTDFIIKDAIKMWFEEHKDCDRDVLQAYEKKKPQIGHFTIMVNDLQTHVGCSMIKNRLLGHFKKLVVIFTCNYSTTNIRGLSTYKTGPTASKCKQRNEEFINLCNDPIDANDLGWHLEKGK
uniref:SCP domain-containing protein n=1 Tax=Glossina brevipalpis TaxID=37001 RepID=A0A1A9WST6_9MUSC